MKKKLLCFLLTCSLTSILLAGCNNSSDNTPDTTDSTETTAPNETTLDNSSDFKTYKFTEIVQGTGFSEQKISDDDKNWSYNKTHYINPDEDVMNFSWEGPTGIGEVSYSTTSGTALIMKNHNGDYALRAFTTGQTPTDTFDATKSWDKSKIITCVHKDVSYIKDGFYNSEISDNTLKYTFAIESTIDDVQHRGYAYFIMTRDTGICYQFYYLENLNVYDDSRAIKVINSLTPISSSEFATKQ